MVLIPDYLLAAISVYLAEMVCCYKRLRSYLHLLTIALWVQSSAFVANVQKYTGPELKGARTRQAVEEEIPHDDSVAEPIAGGGNVEEAADATEEEATEEKVGVTETPKRGRGRPPKNKNDSPAKSPATESPAAPGSKKRGRPPKLKTSSAASEGEETGKESPSEPKRRGRPPKTKTDGSKESVSKASEEDDSEKKDLSSPITPKRRGRPPKSKPEAAEEVEVAKKGKTEEGGATPKRRGRPPKAKAESEAEDGSGDAETAATTPTPKKRGRPPKAKSAS